jgi:hypothetical protein
MSASLEDWERTGPLLARRRVQISARYANRRAFAGDTGLNWRTLHDAERGKRGNFTAETVAAFEDAYRLVPGSLARTLAGAPLEPLPVTPPLARVPLSDGDDNGGGEEAEARFMRLLLRADPRDVPLLQVLGRALDGEGEPMPWREKLAIAQQYLAEFTEKDNGNASTALPPVNLFVAVPHTRSPPGALLLTLP